MAAFRLFYFIYISVVILLAISAVSRLCFRKGDFGKRFSSFANDIGFAMLFPLMIFSKEGIKRLSKQIGEYV